jgi:hypothetical protein
MSGHDWYFTLTDAKPRGVVQTDGFERRLNGSSRYTLPEHVLRLAQAEYEHRFGTEQDYERMQERAGLSILEVVGLLADYCDRLGGKPTAARIETKEET